MRSLSQRFSVLFQLTISLLDPVGVEYCRPETLYDIYDYIRKGRAETIKEAVNLLETDEHNAEMKRIARNTQAIAEANLEVNTINAINNILK